jgi:1,4-alpha-glucan branching enzyme
MKTSEEANVSKRAPPQARKKVRLSCCTPTAGAVQVAGTFNGWEPLSMAKGPGGEWHAEIELGPGRYEYKFLVDGHWCCEPGEPDVFRETTGCVCNEHGTMNRVIEVT